MHLKNSKLSYVPQIQSFDYVRQQPTYAPQQPAYAPQPQQPSYSPSQQEYKKQETEYDPTAPDYTPGIGECETGQLPKYEEVGALITKY